jgi:hypothetical protein
MNAVLSGRAGIAVIRDGQRCFRLEHGAASWAEFSPEEDVWRIFGECRDFEFLEKTDCDATHARLKDAVREADALDLALTLLHPLERSPDTLTTAAEELEEHLTRDTRIAIEKILLACPLPESVDMNRTTSFVQSYPKANAFFARLRNLQPSIRAVHDAWLSVPTSTFAEPADREVFRHYLLRTGVFRQTVIAHRNAMTVSAFAMRVMTLEPINKLNNNREVLAQWAEAIDNDQVGRIRPAPQDVINLAPAKEECYLTTAVCRSLGQPDDCEELEVLRSFRDRVLRATLEGRRDVAAYYATAPAIVRAIDRRPDADAVYLALYQRFIVPAVAAVKREDNRTAYELYREMVVGLQTLVSESGECHGQKPRIRAALQNSTGPSS